MRSDNGPEFVAIALRDWIAAVGAKTAYIEPGSPWEKRLLRKLQRQTARRTAQWRNFLYNEGGTDRDGKLAAPLQYGASALIAGISTASTRSTRLASHKIVGAHASS